jgi:hypothetical protein
VFPLRFIAVLASVIAIPSNFSGEGKGLTIHRLQLIVPRGGTGETVSPKATKNML